MKKQSIGLTAIAALLAANVAFANNVDLNGYYSTQHPQTMSNSVKATMFPPTDITLINGSSDIIFAVVPGSPINDVIYPTKNDHIRHNTYAGLTRIMLKDPSNSVFFDNYLCRLAVMTVYGQPGNYQWNVDNELCN
ncbi:MAG: hypothetical protein A3F14_04380 [Gammaproteobacteria bacterium RIFCSPHIGHO2_12_FULL_43_28]|nr:MAG: hypothetical protein A3F14_04380 [Gammaproteobacteria bacterium RIFCSPHIGHO2_12_FULL_43_28]